MLWWRLYSVRMLPIDFYVKQTVTKEGFSIIAKNERSSIDRFIGRIQAYKLTLQSVYSNSQTRCLGGCNQAHQNNHIIAHIKHRWYVETIIWTRNDHLGNNGNLISEKSLTTSSAVHDMWMIGTKSLNIRFNYNLIINKCISNCSGYSRRIPIKVYSVVASVS